jgi:hypothetical protein
MPGRLTVIQRAGIKAYAIMGSRSVKGKLVMVNA